MQSRITLVLGAITLLASASFAQKTWIVDRSNGAGTHFTDLPAAFKAVKHGDRILLRPGSYTAAKLDKAIQILGLGNPSIVVKTTGLPPVWHPFEISRIPKGKTLRLQGLRFSYLQSSFLGRPTAPLMVATNCPGQISLEACTISGRYKLKTVTGSYTPSVRLQASRVTMDRCTVDRMLKLSVQEATLTQCLLSGQPAKLLLRTLPTNLYQKSALGLDLTCTTAILSHCVITGGSGYTDRQVKLPPSSAARTSGNIVLTGTSGATVQSPTTAMLGDGVLIHDPLVRISQPRFSGFKTILGKQGIPSLSAGGVKRGQGFKLFVTSEPQQAFAVFLALPAAPITVGELGQLWLDPATLIFLGAGIQTSTYNSTLNLPIPNLPSLNGLQLAWQGLSQVRLSGRSGSEWKLTTPIFRTIR